MLLPEELTVFIAIHDGPVIVTVESVIPVLLWIVGANIEIDGGNVRIFSTELFHAKSKRVNTILCDVPVSQLGVYDDIDHERYIDSHQSIEIFQ